MGANQCSVTYEQASVYIYIYIHPFHWNSNKEDLAFSERVTGRSRAVQIFWKYANYQLVSFLWHCAGFYDRLVSSRFTLSRRFVPSFVSLCPGFQACSCTFSSTRNTIRRTHFFPFSSFFQVSLLLFRINF